MTLKIRFHTTEVNFKIPIYPQNPSFGVRGRAEIRVCKQAKIYKGFAKVCLKRLSCLKVIVHGGIVMVNHV